MRAILAITKRPTLVFFAALVIASACGDDAAVEPLLTGDDAAAGSNGSDTDASDTPNGGNSAGGSGGTADDASAGTNTGGMSGDGGEDPGPPDDAGLDGSVPDAGLDADTDASLDAGPNHLPVATTSGPGVALVGQRIKLEADATDPDGDEITYFWTQQSGPQITEFYDAQQQDLTFVPPQAGTYEFTVIAYDPYDNLPGVSVSVDVYDLDGGEVHSLALKPDGSVWSWGTNLSGQLGDGTISTRPEPARVHLFEHLDGGADAGTAPFTAVAIAAGRSHSLALTDSGRVLAWGADNVGQLGNGSASSLAVLAPSLVCNVGASDCEADPLTNIVAITAGYEFSAALRDDGTVVAWGYNTDGQVGDGTYNHAHTPVRVCAPGTAAPCSTFLSGIVSISAGGGGHTLARTATGMVWSWGFNKSGQVGQGDQGNVYERINIPNRVCAQGQTFPCAAFLDGVIAVDAWSGHSLALRNDGVLWAFGGNDEHELGAVTSTVCHSASSCSISPTPVCASGDGPCTTPLNNVVGFSAGRRFSVAVKADGSVWSWGDNDSSQIGDGTIDPRFFPARVCAVGTTAPCGTYLNGVAAIATGNFHVLALKRDGTLLSWGENNQGQTGIDGFVDILVPTEVTGW